MKFTQASAGRPAKLRLQGSWLQKKTPNSATGRGGSAFKIKRVRLITRIG